MVSSIFFVDKQEGRDDLPSPSPDESTAVRTFRFERQPLGSPPLVFENGASEYNRKRGVRTVKVPPKILFSGSNLMVSSTIRERLLELDVPNLHMHPSVYIHDDGKWYEDYWYLTFTEHLDCWDRTTSDYEPVPLEIGGFKLYSVYTYGMNKQVLDALPLSQRLLFKMGGTQDGYVVCHSSIAHLFRGQDNGAMLTLVSDY